jgi:hypothetical protein
MTSTHQRPDCASRYDADAGDEPGRVPLFARTHRSNRPGNLRDELDGNRRHGVDVDAGF